MTLFTVNGDWKRRKNEHHIYYYIRKQGTYKNTFETEADTHTEANETTRVIK